MRLTLRDKLAFLSLSVAHNGCQVEVPNVVLDTGSASTLLSADCLAAIGINPLPGDILHTVRGIGGSEVVFTRRIDHLQVGTASLKQFEIEIGALDYGFEMNGILGMGFLLQTGAILDLADLELRFQE